MITSVTILITTVTNPYKVCNRNYNDCNIPYKVCSKPFKVCNRYYNDCNNPCNVCNNLYNVCNIYYNPKDIPVYLLPNQPFTWPKVLLRNVINLEPSMLRFDNFQKNVKSFNDAFA